MGAHKAVPAPKARGGRPRADDGKVINGILYVLTTSCRWIRANIPVNPRNRSKNRHGRPYELNLEAYKRMRSCVERFFAWLKCGFRRLAMRYERLETTFIAFVQLAHHNILEIFEMSSLLSTQFLFNIMSGKSHAIYGRDEGEQ